MPQWLERMMHRMLVQFKEASPILIATLWLALIFVTIFPPFTPVLAAEKPAWLTQAEWSFLQDRKTIRIAPDPDFPPIESIGSDGIYSGLAADYVRLVEKKLGITFTLDRSKSWDEVLQKARSRQVDVLPAAANTPQRREYLNFSPPHLVLPGVIIVRDQVRDELALSDLYGKSVAIVAGYVWQELIEAKHEKIKVVPVADLETGLRKVAFGSVDAAIATLPVAMGNPQ